MQIIEASTLGFAPGEWPAEFRHDGTSYRLLRRDDVKRDADGDIVSVVYRPVGAPGYVRMAEGIEVLND